MRNWTYLITRLPSTGSTITLGGHLVHTVLRFSGNGLKTSGPSHTGVWRKCVLQGASVANSSSGVWMLNGAVFQSEAPFGVSEFENLLCAQNNGVIFCDYAFISYGRFLVSCQNAGVVNVRYAYLSGNKVLGVYAFNAGTVCAGATCFGYMMGYEETHGALYATSRGFISCQNAVLNVCADTVFNAFKGSYIYKTGSTVTNYETLANPSSSPDNDNSYIV